MYARILDAVGATRPRRFAKGQITGTFAEDQVCVGKMCTRCARAAGAARTARGVVEIHMIQI